MFNPSLKPPQSPPIFNHAPDTVLSIVKAAIDATRELQNSVARLAPEDRTFSSVFLALADADAQLATIVDPLSFYQNVSPSKELRDASNQAKILHRDFVVEASMRVDLYDAIKGAAENIEKSKGELGAEEKRLIEKMLLDGTRAGLALPEETRKTLTDLRKELSQTCLEFSKNFNEENGIVTFSFEELNGVPDDILSGFKKQPAKDGSSELYEVTFKTPDITPVFRFASNPETRRRAVAGFENRLAINEPLFKKVLNLRRQLAKLLGYKTWADFVIEEKMAKTADNVFEFLDGIIEKLRPIGIKDREELLALKKEEHLERGYPFDGEFYRWDNAYYGRKFDEKILNIDASLVKEYFPVPVVVESTLNIYQDLLGLHFQAIEGETWHPDVQQFAVWEKNASDETGFVGYYYLDLYPRENKYGHNAVWTLVPGYQRSSNGDLNYPVAAMVANLAKATSDKPALMGHFDVVTFFHEMGHIFHELLSRTRFSRFHGASGAMDFVEAPSQMLENWCWEPKVLRKMSSHYETKEPLSDDLIDKLVKSRYAHVGLFYLYQGFFATFDMKAHTGQVEEDYTALWNNLRESISLVKNDKEFKPCQGAFQHLIGDYAAGYYGYMYSFVFAADMYATVFKEDPLDPVRGQLYRNEILLPGSSRDDIVSLKKFLGREPTSDAFSKALFG
ncbi:Metalloprotease [Ramaria rubella]|nr:Metalloprotease [Ramaria rubella]